MEPNARAGSRVRTGLIAGVTTLFTMTYIVVVNPLILADPKTGMPFSGVLTGRTAVSAAVCFLPCFFVAPLAAMVPAFATAPVLVLVGAFMFRSVSGIDFKRLEDALPAFLTVVLIPLTFSITQGILWGFIAHAGLYLLAGRARAVSAVMYVLALISAGLLLLGHFA